MSVATCELESPAIRPTPQHSAKRFYAPELDALRFLAFLLVFCRHVTNALGVAKNRADLGTTAQKALPHVSGNASVAHLSTSWAAVQSAAQAFDFGVCLFFFLSAFLITRLLLMERETTGNVDIRNFYIRRSLRIWPLYFFFLGLTVIASSFFPVLRVSGSRLWAAVFFVGNWAAVLHGWDSVAIQPLWSVSVEEQFYLLWPNLARRGKSTIVTVSIFLAAVSLLTLFVLGRREGTQVTQVWPNTLVQCLFLSGGALTACLSSPETRRLPLNKRLLLIACGFASWTTASVGFHVARTNSPGSVDLVLGYLLVLLGTFLVFSGTAGWNAHPIPGWLLYLGKISYGLYVFHFACLLLMEQATAFALGRIHEPHLSPYLTECVADLLALALTLLCATLSYTCLEAPFLRLKGRFTAVQSRPD